MKKLIFTSMLILASASVSMAQDPGWPRQKINSGGKLVFYQPQVDAWNNHTDLSFRMAFSLTPTGGKPTLGVVTINAATDVNVDDRTVLISNLTIKGTHFPSLNSAKAEPLDMMVRTFLPADSSVTISLDRLVASVEKTQVPPTVEVRNDPPMIFVSNRPAMLIHVDGEPVFGKIKDTKLEFVVNSNFPLLIDRAETFKPSSGRVDTVADLEEASVVGAALAEEDGASDRDRSIQNFTASADLKENLNRFEDTPLRFYCCSNPS